MLNTEPRVINLKMVVKKIVTAIMGGNTHIGASDVVPLVNYTNVLGVQTPKALRPDPARPNQYPVMPVAQLVEAVGDISGIPFKMGMIPSRVSEEQTELSRLLGMPEKEGVAVADEPDEDIVPMPDFGAMTEGMLIQHLKGSRVARNQNGSRISEAMAKDELVELASLLHAKNLPIHCFAESPEELEPKTREQAPPSRVPLMNKTQLRTELDRAKIEYNASDSKTVLVSKLEAYFGSLTDDEDKEGDN